MSIRKSFLMLLFSLTAGAASSQPSVNQDTTITTIEHADSLLDITKSRLNAAGLISATNLGVWAVDYYIFEEEWAHINGNTIKNNFRKGFVWDNDAFITNLFAHPYHGGLYFNAARSNGMSFWQSVPFTVGGSLMWEFVMENKFPAINDFLSTSLGGMSLGEITFRISDRLIDDRKVGFTRFGQEALITLISPVRGLNRIISGDAWKRRNIRGNSMPMVPITFYTAIGHRIIADDAKGNKDISNMLCIDLGLIYGNPYDIDNEKPYDYFSFKMGGNIFSKQPIIGRVNAIGMLYSKKIELKKPNHQLTLGVFQHFNYYESKSDIRNVTLSPYKLSEAASVGPGILYKSKLKRNKTFYATAYLSAILLGGSQTDHYNFEDRDYNMGSGFSSKMNLELQFGDKVIMNMNSEDYRLYSWVGYDPNNPEKINPNVQGDKGNSSLSVGRLNFIYLFKKGFLVGIETSYYYRKSIYTYYPDIEHGVTENKVSVGYNF